MEPHCPGEVRQALALDAPLFRHRPYTERDVALARLQLKDGTAGQFRHNRPTEPTRTHPERIARVAGQLLADTIFKGDPQAVRAAKILALRHDALEDETGTRTVLSVYQELEQDFGQSMAQELWAVTTRPLEVLAVAYPAITRKILKGFNYPQVLQYENFLNSPADKPERLKPVLAKVRAQLDALDTNNPACFKKLKMALTLHDKEWRMSGRHGLEGLITLVVRAVDNADPLTVDAKDFRNRRIRLLLDDRIGSSAEQGIETTGASARKLEKRQKAHDNLMKRIWELCNKFDDKLSGKSSDLNGVFSTLAILVDDHFEQSARELRDSIQHVQDKALASFSVRTASHVPHKLPYLRCLSQLAAA